MVTFAKKFMSVKKTKKTKPKKTQKKPLRGGGFRRFLGSVGRVFLAGFFYFQSCHLLTTLIIDEGYRYSSFFFFFRAF
jgi:hypothetical protein